MKKIIILCLCALLGNSGLLLAEGTEVAGETAPVGEPAGMNELPPSETSSKKSSHHKEKKKDKKGKHHHRHRAHHEEHRE